MNIHEYQAKALFEKNGIPVPSGFVVTSGIEAEFAMKRLATTKVVVKAQIHAGGRGKAGGVKLVSSAYECKTTAENMLGSTLVTHQTGALGKTVKKVYVEACTDIDKEYYLALLVDRETASVAIMFSSEGGMDIETVAKETPDKIITVKVDPTLGLRSYHIQQLCSGLKLPKNESTQAASIIKDLYKLFIKYDCSLLEINPLVLDGTGKFVALDGKINFDDNALYRHPDIEILRDFDEEDIREIEASKYDLNYIGLDGNIGCLVNGAGLAMATMDIIKYYNGTPANFLDVGGGASEEMVTQAFKIILQDSNVKAVFVNIFGGIMKCDIVANGLVNAAKALQIKVPLVVRLEGTNVELGREILSKSGIDIVTADDMADGAQKVVKAASGNIR